MPACIHMRDFRENISMGLVNSNPHLHGPFRKTKHVFWSDWFLHCGYVVVRWRLLTEILKILSNSFKTIDTPLNLLRVLKLGVCRLKTISLR